jgi:ADP-L-glycero-D-manno-heptose 6-epimerase
MIIVTGGAGFIGSAFVAKLNENNIRDILIVDNLRTGEKWKNLVGKKYEEFVNKTDFLDALEAGKWQNIEAIIHLGASSATTEKDADYLMKNNVHYTLDLMKWALKNKVRFIYASSAATYGNGSMGYSDDHNIIPKLRPLNMYGYSKQFVDEYVLAHNLQDSVVGLKFFNVFGPNEYHKENQTSVVVKAFYQIKKTGMVKLFKSNIPEFKDGEQLRDFVYVKDVVDVIWWLLNSKETNGIFNVGTGKARTWVDLVTAVFNALNIKTNIEFIDMPDNLKGKYQYFTQAEMKKLLKAGYPLRFTSLEDAINDFVGNFLNSENPYY